MTRFRSIAAGVGIGVWCAFVLLVNGQIDRLRAEVDLMAELLTVQTALVLDLTEVPNGW